MSYKNNIVELIDEDNIDEIQDIVELLDQDDTDTTTVYMFYCIFRDVDWDRIKHIFREAMFYHVYKNSSKNLQLFTNSKYTKDFTTEKIQKMVVDYLVKHKPENYIRELMRQHIILDSEYALQMVKKYASEEDITIGFSDITAMLYEFSLRLNREEKSDVDNIKRLQEIYKKALNLVIENVSKPSDDSWIFTEFFESVQTATLDFEYKHTHEELEYLLKYKYDLSGNIHTFLSDAIIKSEDVEMFRKFLDMYEDIITKDEYGYGILYQDILHVKDRTVFKAFKDILFEKYKPTTNELKKILEK